MVCAWYNRPSVARLLLSKGADVHATDPENYNALYHAARNGNTLMVILLLEHGANAEYQSPEGGGTVLHIAAAQGDVDVAKVLLDHGAKVEPFTKRGRTPLSSAIASSRRRNHDMVRLLLQHGASIDLANSAGPPLLHTAIARNDCLLLRILLDAGADVDVTDEARQSVFDVTDNPEVKLLLRQAKACRSRTSRM